MSKKQPSITVYSTPTCHYCVILKKYLNDKKVKYTNYDVSADQEKAKEMMDKSEQMGVPVTIIKIDDKEEIIIGFDKSKIDQLLKLK